MHATIRRYEGVAQNGTEELKRKINESLVPKLSELPGFGGYWVMESGNGVLTSFSLFKTLAQANESTLVAATWVRDEKLERVLPNEPKITGGEVFAQRTNGMVQA